MRPQCVKPFEFVPALTSGTFRSCADRCDGTEWDSLFCLQREVNQCKHWNGWSGDGLFIVKSPRCPWGSWKTRTVRVGPLRAISTTVHIIQPSSSEVWVKSQRHLMSLLLLHSEILAVDLKDTLKSFLLHSFFEGEIFICQLFWNTTSLLYFLYALLMCICFLMLE